MSSSSFDYSFIFIIIFVYLGSLLGQGFKSKVPLVYLCSSAGEGFKLKVHQLKEGMKRLLILLTVKLDIFI